jgi:hypothetical protein
MRRGDALGREQRTDSDLLPDDRAPFPGEYHGIG